MKMTVSLLAAISLCLGVVISADVQYHLYQRSDIHKVLRNDNTLSSSAVQFKPSLMTYFIIHGWNGGDLDTWALKMKTALLQREDSNIIFVSWKDAKNKDYFQARAFTPAVGKDVAGFISGLEKLFSADRRRMHLIGHSLGAQVAGFAGANLQSPTKIARITALDTTNIGFDCKNNKNDCLDPSDADFIDEINTLTSVLVTGSAHVEFYPIPKDPFKTLIDTGIVGAHYLATDYFIKSIEAGPCAFKAVQCNSLKNFKSGRCNDNEKNNLGFYAKKPRKYPAIQDFYLVIDVNKPC